MRKLVAYDYAIIRVVPRVERGEFVNVGAIVSCPEREFLAARVEIDAERLCLLDPQIDVESVRAHALTFPAICEGGSSAGSIGRLSQRERFHWLVAPRSTVIQLSPVHTGRCADPAVTLDHLMRTLVRVRGDS